jgi:Asp-tRNA(Asn)/Glu-tRNA(Gln) amidotransferase A subunit family amidase
VGVKDIFHLAGAPTTAGSRAFRALFQKKHAREAKTSRAVAGAVALGAVVVGKNKTMEFTGCQNTTADWVEYSFPRNPRGDGMLSPHGSSSGGASAVAAYDWLDVAIGSDGGLGCSWGGGFGRKVD